MNFYEGFLNDEYIKRGREIVKDFFKKIKKLIDKISEA
ncbi:hypothetical protein HRbin06_00360 [archaeon HR06]|nr:hypothetical protein HRbin06_00360 [archaeon HR06]